MKIFIAGHNGMVGSAIYKKISNIKDVEIYVANKASLDLLDQTKTTKYFYNHEFDIVIDCAAKVGGIYSNNTYRADFIYENLQIQNNLIHASYFTNVKKLQPCVLKYNNISVNLDETWDKTDNIIWSFWSWSK